MGLWTENYIEDAATRVETSVYRGRQYRHSNYRTPVDGIHLCGQHSNGEEPCTTAVYPMRPDEARRLFEVAKTVAEVERDGGDFVVDLCIGGDITDDFYSNRQLWPRAIEAWNAPKDPRP
jgi:hypothetical protein